MGLSNRLKERREQLGLTQSEVASLLGITPGAVGNYENGVSTPKADILFKVFDALKCDANYLFQDEMNSRLQKDNATPFEMENLVKKYRDLDDHGKEMVDFTLQKEWERSTSYRTTYQFRDPHAYMVAEDCTSYNANAAHSIPGSSEEDKKHDDDIMDDDNF